jgi:hypothetical protein
MPPSPLLGASRLSQVELGERAATSQPDVSAIEVASACRRWIRSSGCSSGRAIDLWVSPAWARMR